MSPSRIHFQFLVISQTFWRCSSQYSLCVMSLPLRSSSKVSRDEEEVEVGCFKPEEDKGRRRGWAPTCCTCLQPQQRPDWRHWGSCLSSLRRWGWSSRSWSQQQTCKPVFSSNRRRISRAQTRRRKVRRKKRRRRRRADLLWICLRPFSPARLMRSRLHQRQSVMRRRRTRRRKREKSAHSLWTSSTSQMSSPLSRPPPSRPPPPPLPLPPPPPARQVTSDSSPHKH